MLASLVGGVRVAASKEVCLLAVKPNNTGVRTNAGPHDLVEEKNCIKSQAIFKLRLQAE
jgi:hypothetical protein